MKIYQDYDFNMLYNSCWGQAISTLEKIEEYEKEAEFMFLLSDIYIDMPTLTQVNDLLAFDSEWIFETLDISEEE